MSSSRMPMLVRPYTAEDIEAAEALERQRQREARINALAVDRSRFNHPLLEQASRQVAKDWADEERAIARKRARVDVSRIDVLKRVTAKPSLWRRVVWGER